MLKINLMILSLFIIFMVHNVYADNTLPVSSLGPVPPGSCARLIQLCTTCTYNNITSVVDQNLTVVLANVSMSRSGNEYFYDFCSPTQVGTYIVNGFGDLDGSPQPWSYNLIVRNNTLAVLIMLAVTSIAFFFMASFLGNWFLGFIAGALFIITGVYMMINGIFDAANDYTRMLALVIIGIGIMFTAFAGFESISSDEEDGE